MDLLLVSDGQGELRLGLVVASWQWAGIWRGVSLVSGSNTSEVV